MPFVTTLIVFVVVLVSAAAIGFRLFQSPARRSGGVQVPSGSPPIQMGAVTVPRRPWGNTVPNTPPPPIQPTAPMPSSPLPSVFCPRCGVRGASDYCIGCGFDLRVLNSSLPVPAVTAAVPNKRKQNGIWPIVADAASAKFAAKQGMAAAFFCAGSTLLFVFLAHQGMSLLQGINETALVDAAVFAALGIGILRMSRIAAVAALVLYIVERIAIWSQASAIGGLSIPMMAVIVLCFVSGIRGTFAYQRYKGTGLGG